MALRTISKRLSCPFHETHECVMDKVSFTVEVCIPYKVDQYIVITLCTEGNIKKFVDHVLSGRNAQSLTTLLDLLVCSDLRTICSSNSILLKS